MHRPFFFPHEEEEEAGMICIVAREMMDQGQPASAEEVEESSWKVFGTRKPPIKSGTTPRGVLASIREGK